MSLFKGARMCSCVSALVILVFMTSISSISLSEDETPMDYATPPNTPGESGVVERRRMTEVEANRLLNSFDKHISVLFNLHCHAQWNYSTNITLHNERIMIDTELDLLDFMRRASERVLRYDWSDLKDDYVIRQLDLISCPEKAVLSQDKLEQLLHTEAKLVDAFSTTTICIPRNGNLRCLHGESDFSEFYSMTENESDKKILWKQWHGTLGQKIREHFKTAMSISNEAATKNGYADLGDFWRSKYETPDFETDVKKLWNQVKPFYEQLHAYVRKKLAGKYGEAKVSRRGLIPIHLFDYYVGNDWNSVTPFATPFQDIPLLEIEPQIQSKNYTVRTILEMSDDFFVSLGLPPMPRSFWYNSMFEKPEDGRSTMCHGTAWDFRDRKDFRILICATPREGDLYAIHHELGHIHYFIQYKELPFPFRTGANPAFHEAIGDLVLLSVMTPKHLRSIGLLPNSFKESKDGDINFLFSEAVTTVAPMPMSYLIDIWRWDIFRGKIKENEWNTKWWQLREELEGVAPPMERTDKDFDAAVIYHVANFVSYMRYFLSDIIKYQFHRALCKAAGQYVAGDPTKPLYKCNIYGSHAAGKLLRDMMELGSSVNWKEAMRVITKGEDNDFDAGALLDYFEPLITFLVKDNNRTGEVIGWNLEDPVKPTEGTVSSCSNLFTSNGFLVVVVVHYYTVVLKCWL